MPEKNKQKFFIDWILDNSQKDNGFSAKMRRADNPDQEYYALGILCGFDIDIEKESERLPYSVVGAALCRAQVESVSFHSKCKVWEQRPDTVRQFKEPCQCGVPRIFQGAA